MFQCGISRKEVSVATSVLVALCDELAAVGGEGRDGFGASPRQYNRRFAICSDAICHIHLPVMGKEKFSREGRAVNTVFLTGASVSRLVSEGYRDRVANHDARWRQFAGDVKKVIRAK